MKLRHSPATTALPASSDGFPTASELAALRTGYQGLDTCDAVARYLAAHLAAGTSSRAIIWRVRDQLCQVALSRMPLPTALFRTALPR